MFRSSIGGTSTRRHFFRQYRTMIGVTAAIAVVATVCMWAFGGEPKKREPIEKPSSINMEPSTTDQERYKALYDERLMALEKKAGDAESREKRLNQEIERLKNQLNAKKSAEAADRPGNAGNASGDGWPSPEILRPGAPEGDFIVGKNAPKTGFASGTARSANGQQPRPGAEPSQSAARLVITDVTGASAQPPQQILGKLKEEKPATALTYLTSGTFAKARLLNGAIAPTRGQGSGNPVPILLELTDSAVMPNLYRSGIKRCFVTANATGELASERVLVRLERLACIDENGGAVDTKLQGYVSGEDGKTGLRARLVTKSGQAIANALFTGTLSGLGKAVSLAAESSTTSITGTISSSVNNPWKAGLGAGTSHAMDRITDYYLKLASDMFPVLEVDSGREVEIVISQGLSIERIQSN